MATLEDITDLCTDFGYRAVGADSDLLRFIRERLRERETLCEEITCLENRDCDFCIEADRDAQSARDALSRAQLACKCGAARMAAPDFSNLAE